MFKSLVAGFFVVLICGCHSSKPVTSSKELDFVPFTISVPSTWERLDRRGIDSYIGGIIMDDRDTAFFDLGMYSWSLPEENNSTVTRETIDGYNAKVLIATNGAKGITGIYIDSVSGEGQNRDRFNLYGRNLSTRNRDLLITAARTLKFKKRG
jgi:hypothetical protein